eukprot:g757.t1
MSKHRIAASVSHLSSTLFADPEFQKPLSTLNNRHLVTDGKPYLLHEVAEVFNLSRDSLLELQTIERGRSTFLILPSFAPVYEELSAVHPELYSQLNKESHKLTEEDAKLKRRFETVNRLMCIKRDQELFIFHPIGNQGQKLSCCKGVLDTSPEMLVTDVRNLVSTETNGIDLRQIVIGGEHLDWLIASRSSNQINIFTFSWTEPYELKLKCCYNHSGQRITDMKFCPYNYPELIYSCIDGSLHVVDLETILMSDEQDLEIEIVGQKIHSNEGPTPVRAIVEYGPDHSRVLLGLEKHILFIKRAPDGNKHNTVMKFTNDENLLCMQSTNSNPLSPTTDKYLIAILTNKRLLLHDTRAFPEALLSWDLYAETTPPDTLCFSLQHDREVEDVQLGRIIYGDYYTGDLLEATFAIGESRVAMEAPVSTKGEIAAIKRLDGSSSMGLEVVMSRYRQHWDFISQFAYGLSYFSDAFHSKTVHIPSYINRLTLLDPNFRLRQRLLPSREVTQWKEYFKRSNDTLGISFLPPVGTGPALLVRMNPVGDLVFHTMRSVEDPGTLERNKQLQLEDSSFRRFSSTWKVTRDWSLEVKDNSYWTGSKTTVDLNNVSLNCAQREMIVLQPKQLPALTQLWFNVPSYLMSAALKASGKLTYSVNRKRDDLKSAPPIPLTLHQRNAAVSLWTLHYEALYYHFQKDREALESSRTKLGTDYMPRPHFSLRVEKQIDEATSITPDMISGANNVKFLDSNVLNDLRSSISHQIKQASGDSLARHRVKIIPPVYCTKGKDMMQEMRRWESDLSHIEFAGMDEIHIPVLKKDGSGTPEVKLSFKETKHEPIIPLPPRNEEEIFKLRDLEASWKKEWTGRYSKSNY